MLKRVTVKTTPTRNKSKVRTVNMSGECLVGYIHWLYYTKRFTGNINGWKSDARLEPFPTSDGDYSYL